MFSPAEREFLRLLGEPGDGTPEARLARRFPNPVYRRRLLWGIRRKARAASEDWALYARAAASDARVVRPAGEAPTSVPRYAEPIAALLERLIAASKRTSARRAGTARRGAR